MYLFKSPTDKLTGKGDTAGLRQAALSYRYGHRGNAAHAKCHYRGASWQET